MMDAATYLREKARMTQRCSINCSECPLSMGKSKTGKTCAQFEDEDAEKAVEIVEQWSKEHPQKTYLDDLLEKHPEAKCTGGTPPVCAKHLGYIVDCLEYDDCKQC